MTNDDLIRFVGPQFDSKNLFAIGTYLFYQKINPFHYAIAPAGHNHVKYENALIEELNFTTKAQYEVWTERWVVLYRIMTKDARDEGKWSRVQRNAMMHLRHLGKQKSWQMKLARIAAETKA